MTTWNTAKLETFRARVEAEQMAFYNREYPALIHAGPNWETRIKYGSKWARVDVGHSGKYMVTPEGIIHGIKGYGVPHSRTYGTLDTLGDWDWSGYAPARRAKVPA